MRQLKVLVVEDDEIIAMLLAETLEDLGYSVCATAATEQDAITAAHQHAPDLMIVDVGLSQGSGIDAVAAISRTRAVPHIFVTGDTVSVRSRMPEAIVLQKPFLLPELEAAIAMALAQRPAA